MLCNTNGVRVQAVKARESTLEKTGVKKKPREDRKRTMDDKGKHRIENRKLEKGEERERQGEEEGDEKDSKDFCYLT